MRRILSLGGGGIKGAMTAAYLAHLEKASGKRICDCFDLIAGTSTGGMIAIALALGISAEDLVSFYVEDGQKIFPTDRRTGNLVAFFRQLIDQKHDAGRLKAALEKRLHERTLGEAKTRLLIPTTLPAKAEIYLFKTRHHELFRRDHLLKAVDVAMATSAAPTFLPQHNITGLGEFADGGLGANSPVGLAVVEAVSYLQWEPQDLRVLSIETPQEPQVIPKGGALNWLWGPTALARMAALQSSYSKGIALALMQDVGRLPNPERFVEVLSTAFPPGYFGLDNSEQIAALVGLGAAEARKQENRVVEMFMADARQAFVPS